MFYISSDFSKFPVAVEIISTWRSWHANEYNLHLCGLVHPLMMSVHVTQTIHTSLHFAFHSSDLFLLWCVSVVIDNIGYS